MKFTAAVLVSVLLSAAGAIASEQHDALAAGVARRHHQVARNQAHADSPAQPLKRKNNGRCRPRPTSSLVQQESPKTSSTKQETLPTTSVAPQQTQNTNNANNNNNNHVQTNSKLISISEPCQGVSVGATQEVTRNSGPNGAQRWLMCGIENGGGWQPPQIGLDDLKIVDLSEALKDPNSPFHACSAFIDLFYKYGAQYGIPATVLASTAMQESSCNPNTVGGGGEQGLMQITHEKCFDAPGGNCKDPDFNIGRGAQFFSNTLKDSGYNAILALGRYNGYRRGLTYEQAIAARWSPCCRCMNNLDYIHQCVNGWYQNINVYSGKMVLGDYQNLAWCEGH